MHIAVLNPVLTTINVRFMPCTLAMACGEKLATLTQWLLIWGGAALLFREHAHFLVPSEGRRGVKEREFVLDPSLLFAVTHTNFYFCI